MVCSPPGSSVHGILQARIPKWVAISIARGSSPPRDQAHIFCIGKQMLDHWATKETLTLPLVKDWKFPPIQLSANPNPLTPMSETGELTLEDPFGRWSLVEVLSILRSSVNEEGLSVFELSELSVLIWWTVSVIWQFFLHSWQVSITGCARVWRLFNWKGTKTQSLCWAWPFAKNLKHTICTGPRLLLYWCTHCLQATPQLSALQQWSLQSLLPFNIEMRHCFHSIRAFSLCPSVLSRLPPSVPSLCSQPPWHWERLPAVPECPEPAAGGPLCPWLPFWVLRGERSL